MTGLAVAGLVIGSFGLLTALDLVGVGPGLVTIVIGVLLLGVAVWTARSIGPVGARPSFGAISSPFGRPKQSTRPEPPTPPPPDGTAL